MHTFADSSLLNTQDERGFTPLTWAAAFGEIAMVEFLLQKVRNACFQAGRVEMESEITCFQSGGRSQNDGTGTRECPVLGQCWGIRRYC